MAKDYERQHFLTKSYLESFVDESYEGFVVWQYRKSTGKIRPVYTKEAAVGEYLYSIVRSNIQSDDHALEHRFGRIESFYVPFSRKVMECIRALDQGIVLSKSFTPVDRVNVIEFVIIHMIRIPNIRNWVSVEIGRHYGRMRAEGLLRFGEARAHNIEVRAMVQIYDDLRSLAVKNLQLRHTSIEFSVWEKDAVFTCDNPAIQWPPGAGMAHDATQILFPLNRRSFIRFHGSGNKLMFMKHHGSGRTVEFNKMVIEAASDEVYTSDAQQLLKTLHEVGYNASIIRERTRKFRKKGGGLNRKRAGRRDDATSPERASG